MKLFSKIKNWFGIEPKKTVTPFRFSECELISNIAEEDRILIVDMNERLSKNITMAQLAEYVKKHNGRSKRRTKK